MEQSVLEMAQQGQMLAVDLDGTLLKSDMLHESFWNAMSKDWRSAFSAVKALSSGKAALKRALSEVSDVDVTLLPYDAAVIDYVKTWKDAGGKTALVTASDQPIAEKVAAHLGLFDEVHGSDGERNLKGQNKTAFLVEAYGEGRYVYMGDHAADVDVWSKAGAVVTVDAAKETRQKAESLGKVTQHLGQSELNKKAYMKALRPHQWLKNILVFLPMFLAHELTGVAFVQSLFAFIAFSLVASSVYLLNDLLDLAADRDHPRKCKRPFAAGTVPIGHGTGLAGGLLAVGFIISFILGPIFTLVMICYYAMTTGYSLYFKRRMVIDICVLAGLYTIRMVAGGAATGIGLSVWLLAFAIFLFFSLAAVKRQAELVDNIKAGKLGATGRGYHVDDVSIISQMALASGYISVMVLALYMNSPGVTLLYSSPPVLWGICLVLLFWISWIVMTTHRGDMHDDPIVFAVKDRISRICGMLCVGFAVGGALA